MKRKPIKSKINRLVKISQAFFNFLLFLEPPRCTFRKLVGYRVPESKIYKQEKCSSLHECEIKCLENEDFLCRSYVFDAAHHSCSLSPDDSMSFGEIGHIDEEEKGRDLKSVSHLYERSSCIDGKH